VTAGSSNPLGAFVRKLLLCLAAPILFFALSSQALADNLDFTASSTLMTSGEAFTLTFSLPSVITSTTVSTDVNVLLGTTAFTLAGATIDFFPGPPSGLGLFDVSGNNGPVFYLWDFFGDQSYSGSGPFTLLAGKFPLGGPSGAGDFSTLDTSNVDNSPTFDLLNGGSVNVTGGGGPAGTPEPGTFALLGAGLFAVGVLRRKFGLA
jgi:hypothetical protein